MNTPPATMAAFCALGGELPEEERLVLVDSDHRPVIRRVLQGLLKRAARSIFATPLSDDAVPEPFRVHVPAYRRLAAELGYTGPVAWKVREGFTLKTHGPKAGPSYQNWTYLQGWELQNDEPTITSIVFWIPRLFPDSVKKNVEEQLVFLGGLRTRLELPAHHLKGFGSAALQTALIQAHAKRTGERTPLNGYVSRTDTLRVGGSRLDLHWSGGVLGCDSWSDVVRNDDVGVFPLGVEALGNSET